jgi:hypothetical protein
MAAEREVKVVVKTRAEMQGVEITNQKLGEMAKGMAKSNQELQGSYKKLSEEEVQNALKTEQLTTKKSALLAAFKGLKNDIPGVGLLLGALRNPLTAIGAAFMAVRAAVLSYKASIDAAFERQASLSRAIDAIDFAKIARESAEESKKFAASLIEVDTAAKQALASLDQFTKMAEGLKGIQDKVAEADKAAKIQGIQNAVERGEMTQEEGANAIGAVEGMARERKGTIRRAATSKEVNEIDRQRALLQSRRASLQSGIPTQDQIAGAKGLVETAEAGLQNKKSIYEEDLKKFTPEIQDLEAGVAYQRSGLVGKLYGLTPMGMAERVRLKKLKGKLADSFEGYQTADRTRNIEVQNLKEMEERRSSKGTEIKEINQSLDRLKKQRDDLLLQSGLADSEAGALRPFQFADDSERVEKGRIEDRRKAARIQARNNAAGEDFLKEFSDYVLRGEMTWKAAEQILRNVNFGKKADRINDQ